MRFRRGESEIEGVSEREGVRGSEREDGSVWASDRGMEVGSAQGEYSEWTNGHWDGFFRSAVVHLVPRPRVAARQGLPLGGKESGIPSSTSIDRPTHTEGQEGGACPTICHTPPFPPFPSPLSTPPLLGSLLSIPLSPFPFLPLLLVSLSSFPNHRRTNERTNERGKERTNGREARPWVHRLSFHVDLAFLSTVSCRSFGFGGRTGTKRTKRKNEGKRDGKPT